MNEKFHTYLKKSGDEISLSVEQRDRMRRTLHAYMGMKPLRTPASTSVPSFGWFFTMRPIAAVLVLGLFVSSAGISYAAENALPGDLLYPIKTQVNEPVQGALAISSAAKTAWAMDVAGTRVEEAATLAAEGRLSPVTQQELQINFEQHAQQATVAITEAASSSPEAGSEAAVRFEAQLSEYQAVLGQIATAKNVDMTSLTSSVQNERGKIAAVRAQTDSKIASLNTDTSATRMGVAAKAQLDTSAKLARAVTESLSSSSAQTVAVQLNEASDTISAGESFAADNAIPDALGAFQNALSVTARLGVFLKTSSAIHARTGLVVAEPQQEQSTSKKPQRAIKVNGSGKSREGGTASIPAVAATMMLKAATSATTSEVAKPSPTTTSTQETTATATVSTQTQVQTPTQGSSGTSGSAPAQVIPSLPISVPVHISL